MAKSFVKCPQCSAGLSLGNDIAAGQRIQCPKCQKTFTVPAASSRPAEGRRRFKKKKSGMDSQTVTTLVAFSVLLVISAAAIGYFVMKRGRDAAPAAGVGTSIGQLAQEISGEDIDGQQFKLSDYRGKVVVLDFWGHW